MTCGCCVTHFLFVWFVCSIKIFTQCDPHRHWICNYTPKHIPVKLADNKLVYSAGVGSVVFVSVIRGRRHHPVEFTKVLHVPDLRNNLLSVLYLCRNKGFLVSIDSMHMSFRQPPGPPLFMANIGNSNCTFLDAQEVSPSPSG